MTRRLKLVIGATFFALLFIYAGTYFHRTFSLLSMNSEPGWAPYQFGNQVLIVQVTPTRPPSPLQPMDEVLSINGRPLENVFDFTDIFSEIEPGSTYSIITRRNGNVQEHLLQTRPIPLASWMLSGAARLIIPIIFLITGFVVFLLKPFDKQALLLALMFGMFTGAIAATLPAFAGLEWWLLAVSLVVQVASLFLWPVFFHFFQIFPEPSPLLRRFPRLEWYLYLPHLLTIFPYFTALNVLAAFAPDHYLAFRSEFPALGVISLIFGVLYIAGGLLSLLVTYRQAGRSSRRKMRVVVAGSIAGFLPMFVMVGLAFFFNLPTTLPGLSRWLGVIALFAFPLFPLSFAYAIVRHQVIPIRLILRRGVRYLLISRGFFIVQAVVVFATLSFLLTGSRMAGIDSFGPRADIVATMAATALAIAVLTFVNQRVMPMIDRRFFREAYDAQEVLTELGQEMRTVASVNQLLERAVAKIQDALHTENVTIFLLDEATGDYTSAISSYVTEDSFITSDADRDLSLPGNGSIVKRLSQSPNPLIVGMQTGGAPGQSPAAPTPDDPHGRGRAVLRRIKSVLLLPVATKDRLLGIVSLGPRLGDLPYSREDKQLLMAVSWQMAFAIQNAFLVKQAAEEERLRHELEIATTVQRRLFPERAPELERLELAGVCHPARGVGGDYYDFIMLDDGKIGIAVADVAGKGISAALLMSTIQASLRSQAPSVNGRITDLVSSMNRLLHVSTDASSYATFFYAQIDEQTGALTYVNAGHNPPLLIRAGEVTKAHKAGHSVVASSEGRAILAEVEQGLDHNIIPLTIGGTIIGAFHASVYEQETVQMQSGDLLVAYTDGVTEALSVSGEEFGEMRLRSLAARHAHLSACQLTEQIVESVRDWCRDAPQHDDLTLVVMRVK